MTKSRPNRSALPKTEGFLDAIMSGWQQRDDVLPDTRPAATFAAKRRAHFSAAFAGQRIVIEAGELKTRSNDTNYQFRASTEFSYLTGWGSDAEPGSILVFNPTEHGHDVTLYFRERASRDTTEFYANSEIGEFWIGPRPSLVQVAKDLDLPTAAIETYLPTPGELFQDDPDVRQFLAEMRLVKDEFEVREMRAAVTATHAGFDAILRALPDAMAHQRGERIVESAFNAQARLLGNTVGYETIAAAGSHACILHWIRNDGAVRPNDLILVDAGVELDSLYTADITRTIPVSGTFTPLQREVYQAVLDAADAAHAIAQPGVRFGDLHDTALAVIEERTRAWGFLPENASHGHPEQYHRRYMVHGTSHHLGMDVHDCAQARRGMYMDAKLRPGMVFTIEPGLYFQPDDLTVPPEFRGIGVRIEDDVLVTETGFENLSAGIPRSPDAVEAWVQSLR
jgi:Xaa-Pro aminopeptidase